MDSTEYVAALSRSVIKTGRELFVAGGTTLGTAITWRLTHDRGFCVIVAAGLAGTLLGLSYLLRPTR